MTIFQALENHLYLLGILRWGNTPKAKFITISLNCILFTILISDTIANIWFLLFEAQTPTERAGGIHVVLSKLLLFAWYLNFVLKRNQYTSIIIELVKMIEKRMEDSTVYSIFENINKKVEAMTIYFTLFTQVCGFINSHLAIQSSIFDCVRSNCSEESFHQIFPASYPFEWNTRLGYIAYVFTQVFTINAIIPIYTTAVTFTIGFCLFIANFASDLEEKLRHLNQHIISLKDKELSAIERIELKKKFIQIVQFHSEARDFAIRFLQLNEGAVFVCPLYTIAVFSSLALQANDFFKSGDIVGILRIVVMVVGSMIPFFLFCHFGGNITTRFEDVGDAIYQLEWYELPLDMQKDLKPMIALSQKRIFMRGYGDTRTTHSVFKKVLKNKYIYFMVMRKF